MLYGSRSAPLVIVHRLGFEIHHTLVRSGLETPLFYRLSYFVYMWGLKGFIRVLFNLVKECTFGLMKSSRV